MINNDYMQRTLNDDELELRVQENIAKWQDGGHPLAQLDEDQCEILYEIKEIMRNKYDYTTAVPNKESKEVNVDNLKTYVKKLVEAENEMREEFFYKYRLYQQYLNSQADNCNKLFNDADKIVNSITNLRDMYTQVTLKTDSLHNLSEQLMKNQRELKNKKDKIREKLQHFTIYHTLQDNLNNHAHNVNKIEYINMLQQMNDSINYLNENPQYKESQSYKIRYENLLANCLQNVQIYVNGIITAATNQVLEIDNKAMLLVVGNLKTENQLNIDNAFSFYYGKFQNAATKVNNIIQHIENDDNIAVCDMYLRTLTEFQKSYFSQRAPVMQSAVSKALIDLRDKYKTDHSILFRSAGLFIIKVCQDENGCFHYFFKKTSSQLSDYLSTLCLNLYDILRPSLILINHIEVLSELCTILKEMLNDTIQNNPALDQFVEIINQLLQDVEERLVFRTNVFFQYDLNAYEPSPGDLAYPEKLEQMENIAEELSERRADSRSSSISMESQEVANINSGAIGQLRSYTGNSPADLHGMWYPTVKRTLVCLSRLYVCLDREIFQGVAQEALSICVRTIDKAADKIATRKTVLDAKLFQIKHLLIIREQIAPFQVDFTIREMSLDFSNMKNAAMGLVNHRNKIFSLSSNNAILEFLLEGTPKVKEYLIDSRKEIDKQLKLSCENFIMNTTNLLIGNLLQWIQKAEHLQKLFETYKDNTIPLREQEITKPQILAGIITGVQRNIKTKIPEIQKSMRLYLANRETEFILFRPIKNNIINAFIQIDQLLIAGKYTTEDQLLIACPTPEQLNVLISSVSLTAEQDQQNITRALNKLKLVEKPQIIEENV